MTIYFITDKQSDKKVSEYTADAPIELAGYPFDLFDHVPQVEQPVTTMPVPAAPIDSLIDIGPFYDRFGPAKLAVLKSKDEDVMAIRADVQVRAYVDLRRADVRAAIGIIARLVPEVTADIVAAVCRMPVQRHENAKLRASGIEVS